MAPKPDVALATGPLSPAVPASGADVWVADLDNPPVPPEAVLAEAEAIRREGIRSPLAANRWAAARAALRLVLGRYLRIAPAAVELTRAAGGKPRLTAGPEFNLSHSGGLALIAVAAVAVGVDLEQTGRERRFAALAGRWLDPEAAAAVAAAPPARRGAMFYSEWTRHEARRKCGGGGLGGDPPSGPVAVAQLELGAGLAAALALAGTRVQPVRLLRLTAER